MIHSSFSDRNLTEEYTYLNGIEKPKVYKLRSCFTFAYTKKFTFRTVSTAQAHKFLQTRNNVSKKVERVESRELCKQITILYSEFGLSLSQMNVGDE